MWNDKTLMPKCERDETTPTAVVISSLLSGYLPYYIQLLPRQQLMRVSGEKNILLLLHGLQFLHVSEAFLLSA